MKFLQRFVRGRIAKGPDEEMRVEDVFRGRPQGSLSGGGAMEIPSMALVPRINARWNTTRSRACSMVAVAVGAPNARCAASSFDKRKR